MTVASTTRRIEYTGAGNQDTYTFPFEIQDSTHLRVTTRDPAGSPAQVTTLLALTTDYTIPAADIGDPAGGEITLVAGNLASGVVLVIERIVPLTQPTQFRNQGPFLPETHEELADRKTMTQQETKDNYGFQTGMIMLWPTQVGPVTLAPSPEWLLCNGDAVSRTRYADLFAVIGTIFGVGDGSTTFNLPNMTSTFTDVEFMIKT